MGKKSNRIWSGAFTRRTGHGVDHAPSGDPSSRLELLHFIVEGGDPGGIARVDRDLEAHGSRPVTLRTGRFGDVSSRCPTLRLQLAHDCGKVLLVHMQSACVCGRLGIVWHLILLLLVFYHEAPRFTRIISRRASWSDTMRLLPRTARRGPPPCPRRCRAGLSRPHTRRWEKRGRARGCRRR